MTSNETLEQAARQALEALNEAESAFRHPTRGHPARIKMAQAAITALHQALAHQPKQEPVAWATMPEADDWCFVSGSKDPNKKLEGVWVPLYTEPPKRKPLTDEEIGLLTTGAGWSHLETPALLLFARAIEAAHGIGEKK